MRVARRALCARESPRRLALGVLPTLLRATGGRGGPLEGLRLEGLVLTETAATFMAPHEVPSGGDAALHRQDAPRAPRQRHASGSDA